jgi:sec-independent protein translocase protein TatA
MNLPLAFIGGMGYGEMLLVGFIALLLFGKKLPEVARSLGKGVTEFKKGIQGIEDEIRDASSQSPYTELPYSTESKAPEVPKFEPPPAAAPPPNASTPNAPHANPTPPSNPPSDANPTPKSEHPDFGSEPPKT